MTTRSGKERREVVRAVAEKPAFQGRVKQWQHIWCQAHNSHLTLKRWQPVFGPDGKPVQSEAFMQSRYPNLVPVSAPFDLSGRTRILPHADPEVDVDMTESAEPKEKRPRITVTLPGARSTPQQQQVGGVHLSSRRENISKLDIIDKPTKPAAGDSDGKLM